MKMISYLIAIILLMACMVYAQSTCVSGGTDVKYITTSGGWSDINNSTYNLFCVAPGDYTALGKITVTQDGSSSVPKRLEYYNSSNPSDTRHPVKMALSDRATIKWLTFSSANWWIVKQLAFDGKNDSSLTYATVDIISSDNNIFTNLLVEKSGGHNMALRSQSDNNTIEYSVIRDPLFSTGDKIGIVIDSACQSCPTTGTIIQYNEIYNNWEAIQFGGSIPGFNLGAYYPGTIVRDNDMYLTNARYADCNGTVNPNGVCAYSESLLILKGGGEQSNPAKIINNRAWGSRRPVTLTGWGDSILAYGKSNYVLIRNNIVTDVGRGLEMHNDSNADGFSSVIDNIVTNVQVLVANTGFILQNQAGTNIEWYRNVIYDGDEWLLGAPNVDLRCNTFINVGPRSGAGSGTQADYNFYYNTTQYANPGTNDIVQSTASNSNNASLTITRKRITGPEEFTIPFALTTTSSPHYNQCDPNLGSRTGVGIDDRDWTSDILWDFSISDNGDTNVSQGDSVTRLITATVSSGTPDSVFFWKRGTLPTGITIDFSPSYCIPSTSCQTTATINTTGSTPTGNHTITFSGENGQIVKTTDLTVTVQSGGDTVPPSISITSPTSNTTYSTATTPITTISGTATDAVGTTSVTWVNAATSGSGSATGCSGETSCNWSVSSISLNEGSNAITVTGTDAASNDGTDTITVTLDSTAPTRSNGSPSGVLASGTTSTSISLTTNETATCKYGTSAGVAYGSLPNTFSSTNSTSHSTTVSGLSDGNSYTYYVRCQDGLNNANTDDFSISFSVAENTVTIPSAPTSVSTSASPTLVTPTTPTLVSTSASSTVSVSNVPTLVSTSASSTVTFPSVPTGVSTP
jgi:hypothetical protein